jgi:hypothetical protein
MLKAMLAMVSLGFTGVAAAAPVFNVTGGSLLTASGNDFQWISGPVREGGVLTLSEAATVTVEYIGKEAGFADTQFRWGALSGGDAVFGTGAGGGTVGETLAGALPPAAIGAPASFAAGAGALPFNFFVAALGATVQNGQAGANEGIAFWSAAGTDATDVIYLLLDDGGGRPDGDYDDMIVRLTANASLDVQTLSTPEPGTLALILAGLGMFALVSRRRLRI